MASHSLDESGIAQLLVDSELQSCGLRLLNELARSLETRGQGLLREDMLARVERPRDYLRLRGWWHGNLHGRHIGVGEDFIHGGVAACPVLMGDIPRDAGVIVIHADGRNKVSKALVTRQLCMSGDLA
jgi:hypothetical protein